MTAELGFVIVVTAVPILLPAFLIWTGVTNRGSAFRHGLVAGIVFGGLGLWLTAFSVMAYDAGPGSLPWAGAAWIVFAGAEVLAFVFLLIVVAKMPPLSEGIGGMWKLGIAAVVVGSVGLWGVILVIQADTGNAF